MHQCTNATMHARAPCSGIKGAGRRRRPPPNPPVQRQAVHASPSRRQRGDAHWGGVPSVQHAHIVQLRAVVRGAHCRLKDQDGTAAEASPHALTDRCKGEHGAVCVDLWGVGF